MKFTFGLVCLLVAVSLTLGSEMCLARPPNLDKGASCGGAISCQYGLYCDERATCQPLLKLGEPCNYNGDCIPPSQCLGPIGAKTCIANANPGDKCEVSPLTNSTAPRCGDSLICGLVDVDTYACVGGSVGDSCKQDNNCKGLLTCTGNVCSALLDNANCTSSSDCSPLSFCDSTLLFCTPKKPAGSVCNYGLDECAFGTYCSRKTVADTVYTCTDSFSKENGDYCYDSRECKSKRCFSNYCAKDSKLTCLGTGCTYGEFCGCAGIVSIGGSGSCYSDPCTEKREALNTCLSKSCRSSTTNYPGACALRNCEKESSDLADCSPAGTLSVSLFTLFFAFISLWILKN